jgi:hypothetical protein
MDVIFILSIETAESEESEKEILNRGYRGGAVPFPTKRRKMKLIISLVMRRI